MSSVDLTATSFPEALLDARPDAGRDGTGDESRRSRAGWRMTGRLVVGAAAVALWEVLARAGTLGRTVPAASAVVDHILTHLDDYWSHGVATFTTAVVGLALGTLVGCLAAVAFAASPVAERSLRGTFLAVYCAPTIVLLPVLAATFSTTTTRLLLIVMMVSYPMMVSVLLGLRGVDQRSVDLVRVSGGGALTVMRRVRLPHALPGLLSGLHIAIPAAVLGAMLAELAGGRWGFGLYLISGLKGGDRPLVWGVTLVVTAVSAAGYLGCGALAERVRRRHNQVETTESGLFTAARRAGDSSTSGRWLAPLGWAAVGATVPLVAWWAVVGVFGRSEIVAKGPLDVWHHLVDGPGAADNRAQVLEAMGSTLTHTALGFAAGLGAALVLAVLLESRPSLRSAILPGALVSQTVPLVALVPLLLVTFGRGTTTMVLIGISITFFPSFVMVSHGLREVPSTLIDLVRAAGGGQFATLWKVRLPNAVPHLTAAARLLAPRAILGVVLAEYVATGQGLGFLVYRARGQLDYGMMWAGAAVAVVVSCVVYWLAGRVEHLVVGRFAGR